MSSILSIAYSGLNAFQRALSVAGNNITNYNVRGYSRQTANFSPTGSVRTGNFYIGTGVGIDRVSRSVDQYANAHVRNSGSLRSQYETYHQQAIQIDKLLSGEGSNLSDSMQKFFKALGELNNSPDSMASRNVAFSASQSMVGQFNLMQSRLDEYQNNSSGQIREVITQINEYNKDLASLNQQIMLNRGAPELMDKRDAILEDLAKLIDVQVLNQDDGTVSVMLSSGESLVTGTVPTTLAVNVNQKLNIGTQVVFRNATGEVDITSKVHSGKLGGLLDYEHNVVNQAIKMIGQVSIGLAQKFNEQHVLGMDMKNNVGNLFFQDYNTPALQLGRSIASSRNTGTATLSVAISDISQIDLNDYDLLVSDTGTNEIRMINKADGTSTTLNWSSSPPAPPAGQIVFKGMTITVDNIANLANQDQFAIVPTRQAARDLKLQISSGLEIALAAPVKVQSALTNLGSGQINLGTMFNTTDLNKEYRIDFISATQYNLVNVTDSTTTGPLPFTPNSSNTVPIPDALSPSYSVVLSGAPGAGDQFSMSFNAGGFGDNRNGVSLMALQQNKFFSGGQEGLFDRYGSLLTNVGTQTNQAKINLDSATVINAQAVDLQQGVSGVNLQEETANVMQLQQAFQAAGKLVEVANQLMNTIFEIVR